MRKLPFVMVISALLSSCYSYKIFPKEYRGYSCSDAKQKAYIINPELVNETRILEHSGIFEIVRDSSNAAAFGIRLYKIKKDLVCGQGATASLITLGQVPVLFPDKYQFRFDEVRPAETITRSFELDIATRLWFWDLFNFRKNFNEKAGQTLLAKYYEG